MSIYEKRKIVGEKNRKENMRNPFLYFSKNYSKHPNLSRVAMKVLSRPGTSAESERNYSNTGILTEGRKNKTGFVQIRHRSIYKSYLSYQNDQ